MDPLRLSDGRAIPSEELQWRFARASGPGGQSVNTTDSAVRLSWDVANTAVLDGAERDRVLGRLARRTVQGTVVVTAREHRSQWANRREAAERLIAFVDGALAPQGVRRTSTTNRAAKRERLAGKKRRSTVKQLRAKPGRDD